jgi:CDP-diacylglycerol---serine O-phosphatidyltransferase
MNWRAAIPNALTLGNLACGVLAIFAQAFMAINHSPFGTLHTFWSTLPAWAFIVLAALLDAADGAVARALKSESTLGAQLDSLADVVSFGVAPAFLLYSRLGASVSAVGSGEFGVIISLIAVIGLPLAASYRLARFNVEPLTSHAHFEGLPSPAAGLMVVGVAFLITGDNYLSALTYQTTTAASISIAMVSRWPFLSFKGSTKEKLALVAVFAAGALLAWLTEWQPWVVLATLALYAVVSRVLITPVRRAA